MKNRRAAAIAVVAAALAGGLRSGHAADAPVAALTAIDSVAGSVCGLVRAGHPLAGPAVQARIDALRVRLAALGAVVVPALSADGLRATVAPVGLARDCRGAVSSALRARLVEPGMFRATPKGKPPPHPQERADPHGSAETGLGASAPIVLRPLPPPAPPPPPQPAMAAPPPPAAPAPPAPALSAVDAALAKLATGVAAFNPPDHATLGEPTQVEARLSASETAPQLLAELPASGNPQSAPLKISQQMVATLDGGGAFDVSPAGPQSQFVSGAASTVWDWTITPKLQGSQKLTVGFDVVLKVGDQTGTRRINTLQRTVSVVVAPPKGVGGWLDYLKQRFDQVSWLWSIPPVAAGLAFAWRWLTGRGKPKPGSSDGAA